MKVLGGLLAAVLCVSIVTAPALAIQNQAFGVKPQPLVVDGATRQSFQIPLNLGAEYEDAVRVYNRTDQPVDLELYAADAQAGADASISVGFKDSHPKGVGAWISLSRTKVSLPPRGMTDVSFRVKVASAKPSPSLGAVVVQNTATGLATDLAERLDIVVRTAPQGSPTTSKKLRPVFLRSPWVIIAIVGLILVLALLAIAWRRRRRTKDTVVPPGEVEKKKEPEPDVVPTSSLPVIRRLGTSRSPLDANEDEGQDENRPLLDDDLLVEIDEPSLVDETAIDDLDVDELPPARRRVTPPRKPPVEEKPPVKKRSVAKKVAAAKPKSAKKKTAAPRNYIPLEDL